MHNFSGLNLNQLFYRVVFNKLDSFQILGCFFHEKFKSVFSTYSCPLKYIAKPTESLSSQSTKARLNHFKKEMINSEMSFYISTGGNVTSTDNGIYPGSKGSIETLRRYESFDETTHYSDFDSGMETTLKVMSYNVLSQTLLEQHHYLYEKQSSKILNWSYRSKLILAEILTVNPDVLCLQEVEGNHIPTFYKTLERYGYQGVTKMKTGYKPDGLAIFFKVPLIKLVELETVEFKQPAVIQLATRDNVGLIAKLEKNGKKFLVANTHLLYNPKRTEVRLAQLQIFLAEIDRIKRKDPDGLDILLMGDLNSTPHSPVLTLLNQGKLLSTYRPLPPCLGVSPECVHLEKESKLYHSQKQVISPCEGKEELLPLPSVSSAVHQSYLLSHPFKFHSVYDLKENSNRGVTTFQHGWVLVDYMFYSDGIRLMSRLSLPTAAECDLHVRFLPNEFNPSDHLPLVGEFIIY
ncbi:unnamed protein product [Nezara viridula]|uniref:Endonuclease/exonuclease/phosphatase domain-containing protein n=1 Tax=Nezara viridula TaxID=85310 RepID=A0A9P0DYB1_NEZVI|nr:unnamed protein product [Nezara viridula]